MICRSCNRVSPSNIRSYFGGTTAGRDLHLTKTHAMQSQDLSVLGHIQTSHNVFAQSAWQHYRSASDRFPFHRNSGTHFAGFAVPFSPDSRYPRAGIFRELTENKRIVGEATVNALELLYNNKNAALFTGYLDTMMVGFMMKWKGGRRYRWFSSIECVP